jgi:hypothetical protein
MKQTEPKHCCMSHFYQYQHLVVDKDLDNYPDEIQCPQCGRIGKLTETQKDVSDTMGLPPQTIVTTVTNYVWYVPPGGTTDVVM